MRRFDLLRRAPDDLLDLAQYASGYSDQLADALVDDAYDCFERLAEFPLLGRERLDLGSGLRSFTLNRRRLTVYYYAQPEQRDRVLIARVFRQERDVGESDFD